MELAVGIFRGSLGIAALIGICFLLSNNRKAIDWGLVVKGLLIQLGLALALLNIPFIRIIFKVISDFFVKILKFTEAGATFLFAGLMDPSLSFGYIFAFQVLPTIIFFCFILFRNFATNNFRICLVNEKSYGFIWI